MKEFYITEKFREASRMSKPNLLEKVVNPFASRPLTSLMGVFGALGVFNYQLFNDGNLAQTGLVGGAVMAGALGAKFLYDKYREHKYNKVELKTEGSIRNVGDTKVYMNAKNPDEYMIAKVVDDNNIELTYSQKFRRSIGNPVQEALTQAVIDNAMNLAFTRGISRNVLVSKGEAKGSKFLAGYLELQNYSMGKPSFIVPVTNEAYKQFRAQNEAIFSMQGRFINFGNGIINRFRSDFPKTDKIFAKTQDSFNPEGVKSQNDILVENANKEFEKQKELEKQQAKERKAKEVSAPESDKSKDISQPEKPKEKEVQETPKFGDGLGIGSFGMA